MLNVKSVLKGVLLLLLIAATAFPAAVDAPDTTGLSTEDRQSLEIATRVQTVLFEMDQQAGRRSDRPYTDEEWETTLKQTTDKVLDAYQPAGLTPQKKSLVKKLLSVLDWRLVVQYVKRMAGHGVKIAKTNGVVAAGGIALGSVLDIALPLAFAKAGLPALAAITFFVPTREIVIGGAFLGQHILLEQRLTKIYGGKENYKKMKASYAKAREELFLRGKGDVITPLLKEGQATEGVVVSDYFLTNRAMEKLGFSVPHLTYKALLDFLKENKFDDGFLRAMENDLHTDPKLKATLIIQHLLSTDNATLMQKLRERFAKSFVAISESPYGNDVKRWARSFAGVKTLDEMHARLLAAPRDVPAVVIARVFHQAILPTLFHSLEGVPWYRIGKLNTEFHEILAAAEKAPGENWSDGWAMRSSQYLSKIAKKDLCKQSMVAIARAS